MNVGHRIRLRILLVVGFTICVVIAGWAALNTRHQVACGVTLDKCWALSFRLYSEDAPQRKYPPLSAQPGVLFPRLGGVYPDYISQDDHPLFCSAASRTYKALPLNEKFSDSTYVYFGYALQNEDELMAFVDAYDGFLAAGVSFYEDLPAPDGLGSFGGDQFLRLSRDLIDVYGGAARDLPVLIELPNFSQDGIGFRHRRPGGYVLPLAGSARFIEYGDAWPMVPRIIESVIKIKLTYAQSQLEKL